jgi:hypothetical protein
MHELLSWRWRRQGSLAAKGVVVVLLTACAHVGARSSNTSPVLDTSSAPSGSIDWTHPLSDGMAVDSIAEAAKYVTFVVVSPRGLGDPIAIYVDDPKQISGDGAVMALVYDHPRYGTFWVTEQDPSPTAASFADQIKACQEVPCDGDPAIVQIQGDQEGLVVSAQSTGVTGLTWIDGPVQIILNGPYDIFTKELAVDAADQI